jgi:UDP-MurNAc hydroxylase
MKLRFVSHASFSVESNGITLLCDPWLLGKAFNQGWALVSPSAFVDWKKIDYIWISHQHPDHLNFPTLKSLDKNERRNIKMLYQKHASDRIPRVLRGMGYRNIHELKLHLWTHLSAGVDVMCGSCGSMDSWIAIRVDGITLLNLNDCVISLHHLENVARLVGRVTILLTQFSFANWIGNNADEKGEIVRKLQDFEYRVRLFRPELTVPFASFIYFCNKENSWMNEFAITPQRIADLNLPGVSFMYPEDEWDSTARVLDSNAAVDKYMYDISAEKKIDPTPHGVSVSTLQHVVDRTLSTVRARFGRLLISQINPFTIYLHDLDILLLINPASKCETFPATDETRNAARYVMCSQVAWYAFAYSWGWGAMEVSGMYHDRLLNDSNHLSLYLNILATEVLPFGGIRQLLRTLRFFWTKRVELTCRVRERYLGLFTFGTATERQRVATVTRNGTT